MICPSTVAAYADPYRLLWIVASHVDECRETDTRCGDDLHGSACAVGHRTPGLKHNPGHTVDDKRARADGAERVASRVYVHLDGKIGEATPKGVGLANDARYQHAEAVGDGVVILIRHELWVTHEAV